MPTLGAFIEAGTLAEWKIAPGAHVKRGDIVAVVDTDKAAIEIETWQAGVVRELVARPGDKLAVGAVLAVIEEESGAETAAAPPAAAATSGPAAPGPASPAHAKASPAARQRALELGVALEGITGTGPGGAVTRADVELAGAPAPPETTPAPPDTTPAPPETTSAPPETTPMRRAIALAVERSNREIPHYHLAREIELTRALAWLAAWNAARPPAERMLPAALLLRATALALAASPRLNGFWQDDGFRPSPDVHLGVAIRLRHGGLVVPALLDVGRKPVVQVMAELADLANRARAGTLRRAELTEATATVTNLGDRGATTVHGVIFPPQVVLVGFGRISRRPWVDGEAVVAREAVTASLAADHRASDGHEGSAFLEALARFLQEPDQL